MPVEWVDDIESSTLDVGPYVLHADRWDTAQGILWVSYCNSKEIGQHPTREAAKSAAEAEARRGLWANLKALGAPNIKRAIAAWFGEEGEFDMADYEADMRRAFDAGMESDNG